MIRVRDLCLHFRAVSVSARIAVCGVLILGAGACSKSPSPTAPSPTPAAPTPTVAAPAVSQVARVVQGRVEGLNHVIQLEWTAVPGAASYVVEAVELISRQTTTTDVTDTRFDWSTPGRWCFGVRSKNSAGTSPPANCVSGSYIVDMRDVIEAMFFGEGPYRDNELAGAFRVASMRAWPAGSNVPVVVGNNVPAVQHAIVSRVTEQFVRAAGIYSMGVIPSSIVEPPRLDLGRIRVINPPAEQRGVQCPNVGTRVIEGCAQIPTTAEGTIRAAQVVLWANTPYLAGHELFHAFGVFHVLLPTGSQPPAGTPGLLMQSPRPSPEPAEISPIELEAIRLVYSNGFRNGTPKQDFIVRGLIHSR